MELLKICVNFDKDFKFMWTWMDDDVLLALLTDRLLGTIFHLHCAVPRLIMECFQAGIEDVCFDRLKRHSHCMWSCSIFFHSDRAKLE